MGLGILMILVGAPLITIGIWAIKDSDNWWFRMFKHILDDVEQNDVTLSSMKLRGVMALIVGILATFFGIQRCFL
ncbi:hypothetical protein GRF59_01235 [Paenibacillus sp. HJL G12]|uniref:Uncharacterized protein n=1 Tax=Paenibacillus dendrobii TaxID=2691084 RepID=A0A7X3IF91_9BACL|nr:hypothetical protein [Paenibacillus dendrobii]MWV42241.1 hypothetical protein [Paenibacillus dendrobii]